MRFRLERERERVRADIFILCTAVQCCKEGKTSAKNSHLWLTSREYLILPFVLLSVLMDKEYIANKLFYFVTTITVCHTLLTDDKVPLTIPSGTDHSFNEVGTEIWKRKMNTIDCLHSLWLIINFESSFAWYILKSIAASQFSRIWRIPDGYLWILKKKFKMES